MPQASSKTFINDFTSGPVLPSLITFTMPLFLSNLLQAVYNVVDMVVVGHVVGEVGLSGLSIGGDLLTFLTFLSMGFASASQVIIAQYIGAGQRDRLSRFIGTMSTFLLICAAALSVICLSLRTHILSWMNTPAESWGQALDYATVCMVGLIFIYGYNIVSAIMRGMGDSRRPFMFVAIAAVLNLILDILFVAVFRWEAFGAALATVIAQAVSFLTALIYLYRNRSRFGFDFARKNFLIDRRELGVLLKLGIPFALRSAAVMFSKLLVNSWINGYGVTISAVTGVTYKVDSVTNLMGIAVNTAGSSMTGQNIGAQKYERVPRILGAAFVLNGIWYALMMFIVYFFPAIVFGMFTSDLNVLTVCLEYVPMAMINFACGALRNTMNTFTGGSGNYKYNLAVAIMDGIVARVGLSLLFGLAMGMGYHGFWLGNALAGITPFLLGVVYYASGRWKKTSDILAGDAAQNDSET